LPPADLGADLLPLPPAVVARSLFYNDAALLDGPTAPTLARIMGRLSPDGHGGRLLSHWFHRFASTAHSERAGPQQMIDAFAAVAGADPSLWNLDLLPFRVTGVHNRIDLAKLRADGHCGELRVSLASLDPIYQPLHLLFIFQQPLADGDREPDGRVTCGATARRWLALSALAPTELPAARDALFDEGLARGRFALAETVEFTVSPWEWRQWVPGPDPAGQLPFVLDNPPLFQTVDAESLNAPGPLRDDFLAWVAGQANAIDQRRAEIPERFRRPSARVIQGVPRTVLSLDGLAPAIAAAHPSLRAKLELVGCPACHTTDADFVQTRPDRTPSPFYEKELEARRVHLEALARGEAPDAPFGPLQANPKLP
jgi:hypothetical protein